VSANDLHAAPFFSEAAFLYFRGILSLFTGQELSKNECERFWRWSGTLTGASCWIWSALTQFSAWKYPVLLATQAQPARCSFITPLNTFTDVFTECDMKLFEQLFVMDPP